jgi:ADP-heptose:LPS heptosyltransferase/glycosyltransferase involved in cell wall biosynthesis
MKKILSPLTKLESPLKEGSPYCIDPCGVWFNPEAKEPATLGKPLEGQASPNQTDWPPYDYITTLLELYGKKSLKGARVLDVGSDSLNLIASFSRKGATVAERTTALNLDAIPQDPWDVIAYIHTFQRIPLKDALEQLTQVEKNLTKNGLVFLRLPDYGVPGFERDLTEQHYRQAACFWNLRGFLELLWRQGHFEVLYTTTVSPGQRDYILRKIDKRPTICAGMIAKNEERDLPPCLDSLNGVVDGIVFLDTGSTDKTLEVIKNHPFLPASAKHIETYLGASEKDEKGEWKLWDFGKARNKYVEKIESLGFDFVLWMDADDELIDGPAVRNLTLLRNVDSHGIQIEAGNLRWPHHRLWRTGLGIRYSGRCHEYPGLRGTDEIHKDLTIRHNGAAGLGESSNARNLRILKKEVEEAPTPRNCFYLGNTYKDGGNYKEAIPAYEKRIAFGKGFEDEYWFAVLYKARCERSAGLLDVARKTLLKAIHEKPEWAEFWMELSYLESQASDRMKQLGYALLAADRPVVPTTLFRERDKYTDQPYRSISWGLLQLGHFESALSFAEKAREKIGSFDQDWENFILRIKEVLPKKEGTKPSICWHRPGALGDIVMTLYWAQAFRALYPKDQYRLVYKCAPSIKPHLEFLILAAGFDEVVTTESKEIFDKQYDLVGYPLSEGYPEKPMSKHLLEYFGQELGFTSAKGGGLRLPQLDSGLLAPDYPYVTLHVKSGWSPYKEWPLERWEELCKRLHSSGIPVIQIGGPDDPKIPGTSGFLGKTVQEALMLQSHAVLHIGIDSWTNHTTSILWAEEDKFFQTPAVILWGSTQASAAGYAKNVNISKGLPCQPCFKEDPKISRQSRGICTNPGGQTYEKPQHACMQAITVDEVFEAVQKLWKDILDLS